MADDSTANPPPKTDGGPSSADPAAAAGDKKKEKKQRTDVVVPPKKPKLSKAERRALQEAQRAAKAAGGGKPSGKGAKGDRSEAQASSSDGSRKAPRKPEESKIEGSADNMKDSAASSDDKEVSLFSHLPKPKDVDTYLVPSPANNTPTKNSIHPAIQTLGHLYQTHAIVGGNARCRAMLQAFALLLQTYTPPETSRDFRHDLDHSLLKPAFQYWTTQCRPHSVSMGNAFSFLKLAVANLSRDLAWNAARDHLLESIEAYVTERIEFAGKAISRHAGSKIAPNGDVVLVYGKSEVINRLLLDAALVDKKTFRVIVVDSRPMLEGRDTLEILSRAGIPCTYVLLNALSYLMRDVTKVFLGGAALMSNGSVLSRIGTACVALLANSNRIPLLVACETYKICSRVQLESITSNELGDAEEVACTDCARTAPSNRWRETPVEEEKDILSDWKDQPNLKLLNLMYDLTPPDYVTGIVTEVGILPPSSVAVLLREMSPESVGTK